MPSEQLTRLLSGTCQLSSNTDEAVRLLIRSQPTLIGQYVFAMRQKLDREQALEGSRLDARRGNIALRRLYLQRGRLEAQIRVGQNPEFLQCDLDAVLLDIEEAESQAALQSALDRDCQREIALCEAELQRIEAANGGSFSELDKAAFQGQMAGNTHGIYAMKMAAVSLAKMLDIPIEVATLLIEIPPESRPAIWRAYQAQLHSVGQFLEVLNGSDAGSLQLGTERDDHLPSGADPQFSPV
jgi:hypothetical protein